MKMKISTKLLWQINKNKRWPASLIRIYNRGNKTHDVEVIDYWRGQFSIGRTETYLLIDRSLEVIDGNHRLIAAYLEGVKYLHVQRVRNFRENSLSNERLRR